VGTKSSEVRSERTDSEVTLLAPISLPASSPNEAVDELLPVLHDAAGWRLGGNNKSESLAPTLREPTCWGATAHDAGMEEGGETEGEQDDFKEKFVLEGVE